MTESVRILSGFAALVTGVEEYFAAHSVSTEVRTGYRQRPQQSNQGPGGANRIVFLPGDLTGAGGKLEPPRDVGFRDIDDAADPPAVVARIRPLVSWERTFMISVWGYDREKPRDELAQLVAVEDLLEQLVKAVEQVRGAGGPNLIWGGITWTVSKENTYGAEALVSAGLVHPLFDELVEIARPGFQIVREGEDAEP